VASLALKEKKEGRKEARKVGRKVSAARGRNQILTSIHLRLQDFKQARSFKASSKTRIKQQAET
jgi:hypothetical protein